MHLTPSAKFNVTSPLFPRQYPLTISCTWTLTTSAKGTIVIEFLTLDTGFGYDKFYIASRNATLPLEVYQSYEDPIVWRFTGSESPKLVLIKQRTINMVWDVSIWSPDKQTGFAVEISWGESNSKFFAACLRKGAQT